MAEGYLIYYLQNLYFNNSLVKGPIRRTNRIPRSANQTCRVKKGMLLHTASQALILWQTCRVMASRARRNWCLSESDSWLVESNSCVK